MAVEGIVGSMATAYQAPTVKKVEAPAAEPVKVNVGYSDDGVVSEIAKEVRTVNTVSDSKDGSTNNEGTQKQASEETVKQALSDINKRLRNNTECVFGVHEKTNRIMIQIVDKDSKEVIKELPPEKTLDMIAKAWELAGILVDEKL